MRWHSTFDMDLVFTSISDRKKLYLHYRATLTIFFGPWFLRRAENVPDEKKNWHLCAFFIFSSNMPKSVEFFRLESPRKFFGSRVLAWVGWDTGNDAFFLSASLVDSDFHKFPYPHTVNLHDFQSTWSGYARWKEYHSLLVNVTHSITTCMLWTYFKVLKSMR